MSITASTHWLERSALTIPLRSEAIFNQLWHEGRLRYADGASAAADDVDRANAKLANSTLERGRRLLVVLPDDSPARAPLLLAGALVSQWWDRRDAGRPPGTVLYFGTAVGIREHLSHVRVGKLVLDAVFPQSHPSSRSGTVHRKPQSVDGLPEVICAYSPADPIALIRAYRPSWIAIDCGDADRIRWLPQVLAYVRDANTPTIAWSRNPLSDALKEFVDVAGGDLLRWPFRLAAGEEAHISPLVVQQDEGGINQNLLTAYRFLARASAQRGPSRLAHDAIGIAWRLHRSLEQLSAPFELFEAEADRYWGLQRLTKLLAISERFVDVLSASDSSLSRDLTTALGEHGEALDRLRDYEPPLWTALRRIAVEDASADRERVIVFTIEARRSIFALALLARFNISEQDLADVGTRLSSLAELRKTSAVLGLDSPDVSSRSASPVEGLQPWILFVSLPAAASSARVLPLLAAGGFDALIFPYQVGVLERRVAQWSDALGLSTEEVEHVVTARAGKILQAEPSVAESRTVVFGEPHAITVPSQLKVYGTKGQARPLALSLDEISELGWLLADEESDGPPEGTAELLDDEEEPIWTQEAVELRFSDGWFGLFGRDDVVNIVKPGAGDTVEERFVRALRPGDRVLYIHGQRRQSLYELVLSRVHGHPAIEIHLALIARWREELTRSFRRSIASRLTVEEVLSSLQARGSSLTSAQTIRLWLNGRTIAPSDAEDLRRLAEALDMPFVKQHYKRIDRAAERIRGLHRGLSTRLNRWLQDQALGNTDAAFEVFDGELGLSFQDFRDSLTVLTVESTTTVPGPFLARNLGVLERKQ